MGTFLGFILSLLFFCQTMLLSEPLVEARKTEMKQENESTFAGYLKWIESQKELDRHMETLFKAIDGIPDLERTLKLLNKALEKLKDPANRSRVLALQASLWERMGAFEPAERAFREAYETHPVSSSLPFLFRSSCLLYELGELEKSEKQIRLVLNQTEKPEDRWEAQFHLARIFAITDRLSDALTVGKRLLEETSSYGKDPQTLLYFLYTVTGELGMKKDQETYRLALEKNGGLLKYFILSGEKNKISPLPLPSLFFGRNPLYLGSDREKVSGSSTKMDQGAQSPGTPITSLSISPSRATGIQVGSFSHKENAEYLAKDLKAFGFTALVKQSQWKDGSILYRTIVPLRSDPPENPQTILVKLKEYGFEGFLLFESTGE
ncbi:MAG: SPOR domain-containing protein [Spirochaetes bacterium]|nr:SPOR domain-containing protein [Spirochaetota bacterium]